MMRDDDQQHPGHRRGVAHLAVGERAVVEVEGVEVRRARRDRRCRC